MYSTHRTFCAPVVFGAAALGAPAAKGAAEEPAGEPFGAAPEPDNFPEAPAGPPVRPAGEPFGATPDPENFLKAPAGPPVFCCSPWRRKQKSSLLGAIFLVFVRSSLRSYFGSSFPVRNLNALI